MEKYIFDVDVELSHYDEDIFKKHGYELTKTEVKELPYQEREELVRDMLETHYNHEFFIENNQEVYIIKGGNNNGKK